jgi:hypothetical protein
MLECTALRFKVLVQSLEGLSIISDYAQATYPLP